MTEREDLNEDSDLLDTSYSDAPADDGAETDDGGDEDDDEDLFPEWFDDWTEPPPPVPLPWYRNIRVLGALIGVAFLTLLVSTVLLLTLNSPAKFPTGPRMSTATTASSVAGPSHTGAPQSTAVKPSSSPARVEPAPEAVAPASARPVEPQPVPPAPSAPPRVEVERDRSGQPEGPKVNVTRAPMSFTPTSVPKP